MVIGKGPIRLKLAKMKLWSNGEKDSWRNMTFGSKAATTKTVSITKTKQWPCSIMIETAQLKEVSQREIVVML